MSPNPRLSGNFWVSREPRIDIEIIADHTGGAEALFEHPPAIFPAEAGHAREAPRGLLDGLDDKTGDAVVDHFGHRAAAESDRRRTAGHRLDQHHPERLGPIDRKNLRVGV